MAVVWCHGTECLQCCYLTHDHRLSPAEKPVSPGSSSPAAPGVRWWPGSARTSALSSWPSQSSVDFYLWEVSQPDTNHHIRDSPAVRTGFWLMLISDTSDCDDHAANIVIWNISVRLKMRWRRSSLAVRLLTLTLILHHSQAQKKFAEKVEKVLKSKSSTEKPKLLTGKQSNFNASSCGPTSNTVFCKLEIQTFDILQQFCNNLPAALHHWCS